MEKLKVKKFAMAAGLTSIVIYFGCYLLMAILGESALVQIANLLFHGVDFGGIIRTDISFVETLIGALVSFIFWGSTGYLVAFIYNKMK